MKFELDVDQFYDEDESAQRRVSASSQLFQFRGRDDGIGGGADWSDDVKSVWQSFKATDGNTEGVKYGWKGQEAAWAAIHNESSGMDPTEGKVNCTPCVAKLFVTYIAWYNMRHIESTVVERNKSPLWYQQPQGAMVHGVRVNVVRSWRVGGDDEDDWSVRVANVFKRDSVEELRAVLEELRTADHVFSVTAMALEGESQAGLRPRRTMRCLTQCRCSCCHRARRRRRCA